MAKTASLTAGLVAKKGSAAPTLHMQPAPAAQAPSNPTKNAVGYYKALTVKLDRDRYESLKTAGVKFDKKSQEIFVEALDLWLKAQFN